MSSSRAEIVARIRQAVPQPTTGVVVPRSYGYDAGRTPAQLVELLIDRLVDYHATAAAVDRADLPEAVAGLLSSRGSTSVVLPDGLPNLGLVTATVTRDSADLTALALDRIDSVVTLCRVAIAETGTVVLDGGAGQGRRALSLVPDHHVLIVTADQIVATVSEALQRLNPTAPLTWISGPSATSDIELSRVEGVHGPRVLDVLVVP